LKDWTKTNEASSTTQEDQLELSYRYLGLVPTGVRGDHEGKEVRKDHEEPVDFVE